MTHASLFSGIGGFDLAAQWMGWENVFHCEYDPFCQKVLNHHFPNSKLYKDVRTFDATAYAGRIDILTGGFPCQPFSAAGKRLGTEDERHLWPSMLRIIREVKPSYVVGENVRGLLNWSGGLVFEEVCSDLEAEGYEVTPYLLPACGKNAPHRRDRIWFVARRNAPDTNSGGLEGTTKERRDGFNVEWEGEFGDAPDTELLRLEHGTNPEEVGGGQGEMEKEGGEFTEPIEANGESRTTSNTKNGRCGRGSSKECKERREGVLSGKQKRSQVGGEVEGCSGKRNATDTLRTGRREDNGFRKSKLFNENGQVRNWENFPTQSPLCGGDDGLPKELDGITFPKWRKESIKAYGNAIVPQVAHEIFKAIQKTIT